VGLDVVLQVIMRSFRELEPRIPAAWLCAGFVGGIASGASWMAVDLGAASVSVEIQDLGLGGAATHARGLGSADKSAGGV
jgi:hypothetical protein